MSPADPSDLSVFILVYLSEEQRGLLLQDWDKEGKKRNTETKLQHSGECLG